MKEGAATVHRDLIAIGFGCEVNSYMSRGVHRGGKEGPWETSWTVTYKYRAYTEKGGEIEVDFRGSARTLAEAVEYATDQGYAYLAVFGAMPPQGVTV